MLSFKDLIASDIENVFENPGEFAEELEIVMGSNGRKTPIPKRSENGKCIMSESVRKTLVWGLPYVTQGYL